MITKKTLLLSVCICLIILASTDNLSYAQLPKKPNYMTKSKRSGATRYQGERQAFNKPKRYNAIGLSISALNYFGDLAPRPNSFSTDISFTKPAIGLSFLHRKGPRFTLRWNFMYGVLSGSDAESADPNDESGKYRYVRNLSFRNQIKELSFSGLFDLYKNESNHTRRVSFTPYIFFGLAFFHHNPQAKVPDYDLNGVSLAEAGQWVSLWSLGTEGQNAKLDETDTNYGIKRYSRFQVSLPLGIGARVRLSDIFDLEFETGIRVLFTDYIDDVSRNYVDLSKLDSELARAMSYRTNELTGSFNEEVNAIMSRKYTAKSGYEVIAGYGDEHKDNIRGNVNDKDIFIATTIRLNYVLGRSFYKAKQR